MELSVVVPTLNGCEQLGTCLDALATVAPEAEVVVVNGPSSDGTTGMVRERDDVDVLVEVADRHLNAARNAGIDHASGDAVAFVSRNVTVDHGWRDAVADGLVDGSVVTGPTRPAAAAPRAEGLHSARFAGRDVATVNPYNVALRRGTLDALDGFDEYLAVDDAADLAHRLAAHDEPVAWRAAMATRPTVGTDGGVETPAPHWRARAAAYTVCKNYGLRPDAVARLVGGQLRQGVGSLRNLVRGRGPLSEWLAGGRAALTGLARGARDGLTARRRDAGPRRNPNGRSRRTDRAVSVYDLR